MVTAFVALFVIGNVLIAVVLGVQSFQAQLRRIRRNENRAPRPRKRTATVRRAAFTEAWILGICGVSEWGPKVVPAAASDWDRQDWWILLLVALVVAAFVPVSFLLERARRRAREQDTVAV
jgi:hypothetical protein